MTLVDMIVPSPPTARRGRRTFVQPCRIPFAGGRTVLSRYVVFRSNVIRRRLNRGEALGLGAAAVAGGVLRPRPGARRGHVAVRAALADDGARAAGGWRTTEVLHAPRRFDLMGLRWKRGGHLEAQVARARNGSWSPWLPPSRGRPRPDDGRAPAGTEPAYTGAADVFQLRPAAARAARRPASSARSPPPAARHVTGRLRAGPARARRSVRASRRCHLAGDHLA